MFGNKKKKKDEKKSEDKHKQVHHSPLAHQFMKALDAYEMRRMINELKMRGIRIVYLTDKGFTTIGKKYYEEKLEDKIGDELEKVRKELMPKPKEKDEKKNRNVFRDYFG